MKGDERVKPSGEQRQTSRTNDTTNMDSRLKYGNADGISFVTSCLTTRCDAGDD